MPDLYTLVREWMIPRGWTEAPSPCPGVVILYTREQPDRPDPVYLGQTSSALVAHDQEYPRIMNKWYAGDLGDMQAADAQLTRLKDAIREAFARDTADRNNWNNALLLDVCAPAPFYTGEPSTLRAWVNTWREQRYPLLTRDVSCPVCKSPRTVDLTVAGSPRSRAHECADCGEQF